MLATLARAPRGDGWAVEQKWDGQRGLAAVDGSVTLFSRNGADISRTFPEVVSALDAVRGGRRALVLDGEIVALDDEGRPCFRRLQRRWPQSRRPSPQLLREVPVRFYVFDILELDGKNVRGLPYQQRRALLDAAGLAGKTTAIQAPPFWVGVKSDVCLTSRASTAWRASSPNGWTRPTWLGDHRTGSRRRCAAVPR
jgi:bifunctional non-homologous end joining protein LigD